MTRGGFLKSLFAIAIAPKSLIEISAKLASDNIASTGAGLINKSLISDLQLLTPYYYKNFVEKYGEESYSMLLRDLIKTNEH